MSPPDDAKELDTSWVERCIDEAVEEVDATRQAAQTQNENSEPDSMGGSSPEGDQPEALMTSQFVDVTVEPLPDQSKIEQGYAFYNVFYYWINCIQS